MNAQGFADRAVHRSCSSRWRSRSARSWRRCTKASGRSCRRSSGRSSASSIALRGVDAKPETNWKRYALGVLLVNFIGFLVVYLLQRLQGVLPLNPQGFAAVSPDSSFNTAVSFATNTNWQGYGGESTMSYLTQMLGLAVQNFLSAAIRHGGAGRADPRLRAPAGERDRQLLGRLHAQHALHPAAAVAAARGRAGVAGRRAELLAVPDGRPRRADDDSDAGTRTAGAPVLDAAGNAVTKAEQVTQQTIPLGPAASQIAIKQLGTNGGGFFNVNSAHPFENPTPLSNFLEVLAILLIPAALCYTFGRMVGDTRQGWAVLVAMLVIFVPLTFGAYRGRAGRQSAARSARRRSGGVRHCRPAATWKARKCASASRTPRCGPAATTAASNGSVNSMHDSFTPLGGLVPMWLMQLGEVVFGGVGSGLYGMLMFAIVAVFIAGLMVGRTPEYLGKKIEAYEVKMASLVLLVPPLVVLVGTAIASVMPAGDGSVANPGAHGFSEILYAFSSAGNNNGSAFARPVRQHAVLQHRARHRDVGLALLADDSGAGDRGQPGGEARDRGHRRHAADAHAAVHRDAGRRRADGRCADVRAGAGARARSSSTCR